MTGGNVLSGNATYGIREDVDEPAFGGEPVQGSAVQVSSRTSGVIEPTGNEEPLEFPAPRDWVVKAIVKRKETNGSPLQFAPEVFLELSFGSGAANLTQRIAVPMVGLSLHIPAQHLIAKLVVEGNLSPGVVDCTVMVTPGRPVQSQIAQRVLQSAIDLRVPDYAVGVVGLAYDNLGAQQVAQGLWLYETEDGIVSGAGAPVQQLRAFDGAALDVTLPMGTVGAVAVPYGANAIRMQPFGPLVSYDLQWVVQL